MSHHPQSIPTAVFGVLAPIVDIYRQLHHQQIEEAQSTANTLVDRIRNQTSHSTDDFRSLALALEARGDTYAAAAVQVGPSAWQHAATNYQDSFDAAADLASTRPLSDEIQGTPHQQQTPRDPVVFFKSALCQIHLGRFGLAEFSTINNHLTRLRTHGDSLPYRCHSLRLGLWIAGHTPMVAPALLMAGKATQIPSHTENQRHHTQVQKSPAHASLDNDTHLHLERAARIIEGFRQVHHETQKLLGSRRWSPLAFASVVEPYSGPLHPQSLRWGLPSEQITQTNVMGLFTRPTLPNFPEPDIIYERYLSALHKPKQSSASSTSSTARPVISL